MKKTEGRFYKLVIGFERGGDLHRPIPVGFAIQPEGRSYFIIRPWAMPRICYYLVPHAGDGRASRYTLFGRKVEGDRGLLHFQNPIGHGEYSGRLSGYVAMALRFPLGRFYLDLGSECGPDFVSKCDVSAPSDDEAVPEALPSNVVKFKPKT
jgi:hypothetical protein